VYIAHYSWKEIWVFEMDIFIYISKYIVVYEEYVVTEHGGNMNMGQY